MQTIDTVRAELVATVGEGRPASAIAAVVRELYERIAGLGLPDIPDDDLCWRVADQYTRSMVHVTRDGLLVLGERWGAPPGEDGAAGAARSPVGAAVGGAVLIR